jgi:hypothetical protein
MGPKVETLLRIGGTPFRTNTTQPDRDRLGALYRSGNMLLEMLEAKDGFYCFEGALRIFPLRTVDGSWGIDDWNAPDLWKADYCGLADDMFCFAEDIFGGQFVFRDQTISYFNPETAELREMASDLEAWASNILDDYDFLTGYGFAHQWQSAHGKLKDRDRLMAITPFSLGGEYQVTNFAAIDSVRLMKSMGNIAHQLHNLPNGARVRLTITHPA